MSGICVRPLPQDMGRSFHLQKGEYGSNSIEKAISGGILTYSDAQRMHEFITEQKVTHGISSGRANKIIFTLVRWRHYIGPFEENTIYDLYTGIETLKSGRNRETPYKQNTIRDFLSFLKRFYIWLIENEHSNIPIEKVRAIKVIRRNTMTKTAEQILSEAEVRAMTEACQNSRDRALIATLYEGGFRIKELGILRWNQVKFDDYGVIINVNAKTERPRHIRLVMATNYLIEWKNDYPCAVSGELPVFLTSHRRPLQWATAATQLKKIAVRAGVKKSVTPHLFRHTRITHLLQKGYSESTIKKMMWGNLNTSMLETYVHLTDADIDNEVLLKEGIKVIEQCHSSEMAPHQCRNCNAINPPTHNFCAVCGQPLDDHTQRSMIQLEKEIENTPEYKQLIALLKERISLS